jgi:RimJ/RimL family protein N-acetyltransferase
MEEIQLKPEYHGKGIFRKLYGFILPKIDDSIEFVDAFANIQNEKSIAILEHLGLKNVGLNKNGRSYHFKGQFEKLKEWYENEDN